MRICYFGTYDPTYSRNKILIRGLQENGVEVLECRTDRKGILKYFDLFKKYWKLRNDHDVMVVGFPGFQTVILARFLTSKPIIFDAFVSMYDSMVLDREEVKEGSFRAKYFWWLDKISMTLPEIVLFDTQAHIDFVKEQFNVLDNKFVRIFVGTDTDVFYPREEVPNDIFRVTFSGHYVPLQGAEYVVRAAGLLKDNNDIFFEMIGDGQGKERIIDLRNFLGLKNIRFTGSIPLLDFALKYSKSDVCLGIFGNTNKTQRVIPNRVFESVALGRPVITSDTTAIRELFDENDLFFVRSANAKDIADAILYVKNNPEETKKRIKNAREKLLTNANIELLGQELKKVAEVILKQI